MIKELFGEKKMGRESVKDMPNGIKRILYPTLNAITSFILFYVVYRVYLNNVQIYWIIWVCLSASSVAGSLFIRFFLKFFEGTKKNIQQIVQNLIIPVIYAGLVFMGGISWMFEKFESGAWDLKTFIIIFLLMKLFIFLLADYIADTITFQG